MKWPDDYINQILCGNCLEVMKGIPDKSIDLILTDPPYGVNLKYESYNDTEENWFNLFTSIIPEFKRISKMVIMPSCQISRLEWIYKNFPPDWLICWYKGSVGCSAYVGFNDWEPLLVYGKIHTKLHDYLHYNPSIEFQDYDHPCPKPLGWAKYLIKSATNENNVVLDPFLGSGTTAVACKDLDRKYIGIEISEKYCEIARKRVERHIPNMRLF